MVGIADDDLPAVPGRWIVIPARRWCARRHGVPAVLERLVVPAWRDPLGAARVQRIVHFRLVIHRELHRHPHGMRRISLLPFVLLDHVDDPILPLESGNIGSSTWSSSTNGR